MPDYPWSNDNLHIKRYVFDLLLLVGNAGIGRLCTCSVNHTTEPNGHLSVKKFHCIHISQACLSSTHLFLMACLFFHMLCRFTCNMPDTFLQISE